MTLTNYRRKGDRQAIQWTGENTEEVKEFLGELHFVSANGQFLTYTKIPRSRNATVASVGSYFMDSEPDAIQPATKYHQDKDEFELSWQPA